MLTALISSRCVRILDRTFGNIQLVPEYTIRRIVVRLNAPDEAEAETLMSKHTTSINTLGFQADFESCSFHVLALRSLKALPFSSSHPSQSCSNRDTEFFGKRHATRMDSIEVGQCLHALLGHFGRTSALYECHLPIVLLASLTHDCSGDRASRYYLRSKVQYPRRTRLTGCHM